MRQFFGMSQSGNLKDAVRGLNNPQLILLLSNGDQFEKHVKQLESLYQIGRASCRERVLTSV